MEFSINKLKIKHYLLGGNIKMTQVTAALVKKLRDMTGVGMMDAKRALVAVEGDNPKTYQTFERDQQNGRRRNFRSSSKERSWNLS